MQSHSWYQVLHKPPLSRESWQLRWPQPGCDHSISFVLLTHCRNISQPVVLTQDKANYLQYQLHQVLAIYLVRPSVVLQLLRQVLELDPDAGGKDPDRTQVVKDLSAVPRHNLEVSDDHAAVLLQQFCCSNYCTVTMTVDDLLV